MSTALLYDVHGNLPALEAVLDDARAAGAERFVLGGDYALFGAHPAEAVAALRELPEALWIRGNVDRWCAHPDQAPEGEPFQGAIAACRDAVGEQLVAELGTLQEYCIDGWIVYCHASPVSDVQSFAPEPDNKRDSELLGWAGGETRIVFGHTHIQFQRHGPTHEQLVNPGSVGMPLDGDHRAAYALVGEHGLIEFRRVDYDHEAVATALVDRFGTQEWTQMIAGRLRRASLK